MHLSIDGCRLRLHPIHGLKIDIHLGNHYPTEPMVPKLWTVDNAHRDEQQRSSERLALTVPARLTWKDQGGTTRFASVVTRNISEFGVYVESQSPISIPMYRLVQF